MVLLVRQGWLLKAGDTSSFFETMVVLGNTFLCLLPPWQNVLLRRKWTQPTCIQSKSLKPTWHVASYHWIKKQVCGIGEVLLRIIGKSIVYTIRPHIVESVGHLQLCAGQQAGCEFAVHAMSHIFAEETDAMSLVDAANALTRSIAR